jgi:DNA-binding winged helix-turn-helix (wHTH) protein
VKVAFGAFTLDSDTRQLRRGSTDLHLSPKAFDLLCCLVERQPRVVDKGDLHAQIWPDTHVVDGSLNVLIGEIRRALADNARDPAFIRTVHGIGYAFCGDPAPLGEAAARPHAMRCWLTVADKTFRLGEGVNGVGRDPECSVWLNSDSVSRRHARIVLDSGNRRVTLEDLASKNGTLVGASPIHEVVTMADGDRITFGSVEATLHLWNAEGASETKRISRKRR